MSEGTTDDRTGREPMDERDASQAEEGDGWGAAGVGLLIALFVIAAVATAHSIWATLLR